MSDERSSDAARAMYPALARAEDQRRAPSAPNRDAGARPAWAVSRDPMWQSEPRPVPNRLDRVPGLIRKRR
jgi:hypothetical protein